MHVPAVLLLSVALAMDATAVAAARGVAAPTVRARDVLLVAVAFGGMGGVMPLLGGLLGARFGPWIGAIDHWIAFVLLAGIGAKMLWEARASDDEEEPVGPSPFGLRVLAALALATSIDTFAAGITLPILGAPLGFAAGMIGLTTALFSAAGVVLGHRAGLRFGSRLEVLGGLALIGIGAKILVEHVLA